MSLQGSTPASGVGAGALASQTEVVKGKLSDGSTARLLTKPDNVEVAIPASAMALVAQDGISPAPLTASVIASFAMRLMFDIFACFAFASASASEKPTTPDFSIYPQTEELKRAVSNHTNGAWHLQHSNLLAMTEFSDSGCGVVDSSVTQGGMRRTSSKSFTAFYPKRYAQLPEMELGKLRSVIPELPPTNASPPIDRLIIVSFRQGANRITRSYDSSSLPKAMTQIHSIARVPWLRNFTVQ